MYRLILCVMLICGGAAYAAEVTAGVTSNGLWAHISGGYVRMSTDPACTEAVGVSFNFNGFACYVSLYSENYSMTYEGATWKSADYYRCTLNYGNCKTYYDASYTMIGYKDSGEYTHYSGVYKLLRITNSSTNDRDGDGEPDDTDSDPDDPTKKKDSDNDGVEDDEDCDPNDASNTSKKPNCYHCDDDSYALTSEKCASTHDYDLDGEEPKWDQLRADIKTDMLRLGIDFKAIKTINKDSAKFAIPIPSFPAGTWESLSMTDKTYTVSIDPNNWQDDTVKAHLLKYQPMVATVFKFIFVIVFMLILARTVYTN